MPSLPTSATRPLPPVVKFACSVFAVAHLLIIGLYALHADSGPWPLFNGNSNAQGPKFATSLSIGFSYPYYLEPLQMTHNYHFAANRPTDLAVYFEVQVKNRLGEIKTLKFPDDKANFWVRHRQEILAQYLLPDQRLPPRGSRRLAAKGKEAPKIEIWKPEPDRILRLTEVSELDPVMDTPDLEQPTARVKLLAQSYTRYVCAEQKGVSAELIRHSQLGFMPSDLYVPRPAEVFSELKHYFGEYPRE